MVDGKMYAVRRIGAWTYEVWRDGHRLGSFHFRPHNAQGPITYTNDNPEAQAVANAFLDAYRSESA
jgi:hypothetical protein